MFLKKFILNRYIFISFWMVMTIFFVIFTFYNILDSYQYDIKKELLSKQAHIYINYSKPHIVDGEIIKTIKETIGSDLSALFAYYEGKTNIDIEAGDSFAGVNLNAKVFIYGISSNFILKNSNFQPYSNINYDLQKIKNNFVKKPYIVINKVLDSMFSQPNINIVKCTIYSNGKKYKAHLLGKYNDYSTKAVIYTNIHFARKLLGKSEYERISGYMVRIKNLNYIDSYVKKLRSKIGYGGIIVSDANHINRQQIKLIKKLRSIVYYFSAILIFLSIFACVMWFNSVMLDMQPQIRVLYNMGIDISLRIILYTSIGFVLFALAGFILSQMFSGYILHILFHQTINISFYKYDLFILFIFIFILFFVSSTYTIFSIREKIK